MEAAETNHYDVFISVIGVGAGGGVQCAGAPLFEKSNLIPGLFSMLVILLLTIFSRLALLAFLAVSQTSLCEVFFEGKHYMFC